MQLQPYNTLTLAANTATQLTTPQGTWTVLILNLGPGNLFIKGANTVSATDPASFELPINLSLTLLVNGSIWIAADAAGKASVALIPRP